MKCPKCGCGLILKMEEDTPRSPSAADHLDLPHLLDSINDDNLKGEELAFVTRTRERFEQYGNRTRCSEKEMDWLRRLAR